MENIFEKLDLSGIEKALMEDNCIIEISTITPETQKLTIKNQDNIISTHYGLRSSFISMIFKTSQDYDSDKKIFCYNETKILLSVLDLQFSKQNILIMKKEKGFFKLTITDWDKRPIVSISNKNLADALNEIDSYVSNLSIKDLLYLHKVNLGKININNFYNEAKNDKKQTTRIKK